MNPYSVPTPTVVDTATSAVTAAVPLPGIASIAWIALLVATVVYIGYGWILSYHWFEYMRSRSRAVFSLAVYGAVGLAFFAIIAGSILTL